MEGFWSPPTLCWQLLTASQSTDSVLLSLNKCTHCVHQLPHRKSAWRHYFHWASLPALQKQGVGHFSGKLGGVQRSGIAGQFAQPSQGREDPPERALRQPNPWPWRRSAQTGDSGPFRWSVRTQLQSNFNHNTGSRFQKPSSYIMFIQIVLCPMEFRSERGQTVQTLNSFYFRINLSVKSKQKDTAVLQTRDRCWLWWTFLLLLSLSCNHIYPVLISQSCLGSNCI